MSNVNYLDLAGKVAVVTGAGGGIGRAVVAALSKQGARVVATDRDLAAMAGVDADCRELDVTRPAAIRALADAVAAEYGARWTSGSTTRATWIACPPLIWTRPPGNARRTSI